MDEILREMSYAYQRRHENMGLAWSMMRATLERHSIVLESLASTNLHHNSSDTELLIQTRPFYHREAICVALLLLNVQYENLSESISGALLRDTLQLFQHLDLETIRYGGSEVVHISHKVAKLACQEGQAAILIRPLINLSLTLCPNHTHLNSIDADILQVCISAHMYSYALNFLSTHQFQQIEPTIFPLHALDILRFFYYRGIVFIAVKKFQQALESFDQVLSIPASNISTVAIEAYKKAILVNLIYNGKRYQTPSYASNAISRIHKHVDPFYQNISDAFVADDYNYLCSILQHEQNKMQYLAEGNFGLTRQLLDAFFLCRIVKLSSIYSTITPDRILRYVNKGIPEEEQRYHSNHDILMKLCELFQQKRIHGYIDQEKDMVIFLTEQENRERLNEKQINVITSLQEDMRYAMTTFSSLHLLQQDILQSNNFIAMVLNNHLSSGGGGGGGGGASIRNSDYE